MQAPQRLGRFENLTRIAEGGQATVFRARDSATGETVAVKVLHDGPAFSGEHIERFRFEAETLAAINHPNVVRLLGGDLDGETKYLSFEYLEGNLKETISSDGTLATERAAWIAYQVAQGLGAAHASGVIHRDIKPSNILLTDDETVKLIDFGVARGITARTFTRTGAMIGSAPYMSPEQAEPGLLPQRSDLGPQSDIYSLGIVLYEMLVGRVPYAADSPVAVARMHVEAAVPDVREVNPDVPVWLADIIQKCLQKNPAERYQTTSELASDLAGNMPPLIEQYARLVEREDADRTSTSQRPRSSGGASSTGGGGGRQSHPNRRRPQ